MCFCFVFCFGRFHIVCFALCKKNSKFNLFNGCISGLIATEFKAMRVVTGEALVDRVDYPEPLRFP